MWPPFGIGSLVGNDMSGLLTFIKTQNMIAPEWEKRDWIQIATVVDGFDGIAEALVELVAIDRSRDVGAAVAVQPRHCGRLVLRRIGL
jgi:hypothetical protein